jgi:hypothetical protein
MSFHVFNHAIQTARQAVIDQNEPVFDSALRQAHVATQDVPQVGVRLQQARASFPTLESLRALTLATIVVAEIS